MAVEAANIVDARAMDEAIDWHLRQADMDADAWTCFVAWLEQDAAHARAFDAVSLDLALLSERPDLYPAPVAPIERQPVAAPAPRRTWAWAGGGIAVAAAASLTLMVAPVGTGTKASPYTVATKPGERRDIALNDGTRIELNGATRLQLDHNDSRNVVLETGEATFHVRHDAQDPFTVRAGALSVQDMGTVFNMERDGARLDVQVAEGSVLFQPKREAVTLRAGAAISAQEDLGTIAVTKIDVAKVGGWRSGAVSFAGEPFGRIAAVLNRTDGVLISIDPSLSHQPFTGMVRLSGKAGQDVPHIAALVGAQWHRDGDRWFLSPR